MARPVAKRTTRHFIAATFVATLALLGVAMLAGRACDTWQPAHALGHAVWAKTDQGDRVVLVETLHRSGDDGPSYNAHRLVAIDPENGAVTGPWMLPNTDDMESTVLWAARGDWLWLVSGDSWHPSWYLTKPGQEPADMLTLQARFPQVAAPWAAALVGTDGVLRVESDDKRQWEIDVATGTATEHPGLYLNGNGWSGASNVGCLTLTWREQGRAFVEREAARHSQLDHFALVNASIDEYGGVTETGEVAGGFSRPYFLCDGNGHVATAGGDALVIEHTPDTRISRIGKGGERVWSWTPDEAVDGLEAWAGPGDGATIRVDRAFYGLDGGGKVRWRVER